MHATGVQPAHSGATAMAYQPQPTAFCKPLSLPLWYLEKQRSSCNSSCAPFHNTRATSGHADQSRLTRRHPSSGRLTQHEVRNARAPCCRAPRTPRRPGTAQSAPPRPACAGPRPGPRTRAPPCARRPPAARSPPARAPARAAASWLPHLRVLRMARCWALAGACRAHHQAQALQTRPERGGVPACSKHRWQQPVPK